MNDKLIFFCSGRDLLNISITEPNLALNKSLTMEEGKEYTILVTADLGENMTKTFLWTDLGRNNYSQLPYKIAEVGTGPGILTQYLYNPSSTLTMMVTY